MARIRINGHVVSEPHFHAAKKYTCTGRRKWRPPIDESWNHFFRIPVLQLRREAGPWPHNEYPRREANGERARPHSVK